MRFPLRKPDMHEVITHNTICSDFFFFFFQSVQPAEVDRCETFVVDTGNETERERMSESPFCHKSVLTAVWYIQKCREKKKLFLNGPLVLGGAIWLCVPSTCEWGQHCIHSLMAPLPNTGRHTDFWHLCMERSHWWIRGRLNQDLNGFFFFFFNEKNNWALYILKNRVFWRHLLFALLQIVKRILSPPSHQVGQGEHRQGRKEIRLSSVCDGKPVIPQRKVTQQKQLLWTTSLG